MIGARSQGVFGERERGEEAGDCVYFNFKSHLVCAYLGCGDGGKILLALYGDGHSVNSPTLMNAIGSLGSIIKRACGGFPFWAILPVASSLPCLMIKHLFLTKHL